ncbi:hypothetical protein FDECE_11672 [Fusarium decemcellulare]|nr:hypothetical protein FDECE_11672 [Fusarium decemcellulare]
MDTATTAAETTALRMLFLYDTNHPVSLSATILAAETSSTTYIVTCPSSCEPSDFPKQTITHLEGSHWAGERTWAGATTRWACDLGNGGDDILTDQLGWCSARTIEGDQEDGDSKSRAVNSCFVYARSVPAYITGDPDDVRMAGRGSPYSTTYDADDLISAVSERRQSLNCPTTTASVEKTTETGQAETDATAEASRDKDESKTAAETGSATETGTGTTGGSAGDETTSTASAETSAPNGSRKVSVNKIAVIGCLLLGLWAST